MLVHLMQRSYADIRYHGSHRQYCLRIQKVTGGGLYKRWDQNFYFSKTMIFVSIMMVGHK